MSADYKDIVDALGGLIQKTLEQLTKANNETTTTPSPQDEPSRRLFFAEGIELINVVVKVAGGIELSVTLAGEKARNPMLSQDFGMAATAQQPLPQSPKS